MELSNSKVFFWSRIDLTFSSHSNGISFYSCKHFWINIGYISYSWSVLISILNSIEKIFFLARPIIKFSFQICCTRAKFAYIMCSNIIRQYYIKLMIFISFLVRIMRIESTSKHLQTARIFDSGRIVTYSTLILPTRRLIKSNIPALIRLKWIFQKYNRVYSLFDLHLF